ncbi:MAG: 2-amino-4-hydroxy-6-hydroxymethyldihydropteridine diphosphokinase [Cyanobacteria bacterium P01_F01_bin.150]
MVISTKIESDYNSAPSLGSSTLPHRVAIALGGNLTSVVGNPEATLVAAIDVIRSMADTVLEAKSSLYQTTPVGPPQPDYFNACVVISTMSSATHLMRKLLDIEQQFNRVRRERWGPRTLDLDILLFDDLVLDDPFVQVPHPRMAERAFVLIPLAEIAPQWVHPVLGRTMQMLSQQVSPDGVRLVR